MLNWEYHWILETVGKSGTLILQLITIAGAPRMWLPQKIKWNIDICIYSRRQCGQVLGRRKYPYWDEGTFKELPRQKQTRGPGCF